VERRLAAILAADVVGYSRLMGADEAGTLERLKSLSSRKARDAAQAFRDAAKEGYSAEDYIAMDQPMHGDPSIKDHWLEGYRKAGIEI
jgi:class 3 adenylate cyclase